MKRIKGIFLVAIAAILAVVGRVDAATFQEQFKIMRDTAFVQFFGDSDCVSISAMILGASDIQHTSGDPPITTVGVFAHYTAFNRCTNDFTTGSVLDQSESSFSMSNLNSATATVTIELTEFRFDPATGTHIENPLGPAMLTVSWTGIGQPDRTKINSHTQHPNGFVHNKFKGRFRDATVNATLLFGGADLLAGLTASDASIGDSTSGTLTVLK